MSMVPEPEDDGRTFWDWYEENGSTATSVADDLLCLINPRRCQPQFPVNGGPNFPQRDNTALYIILGLVVILLIALLLKK